VHKDENLALDSQVCATDLVRVPCCPEAYFRRTTDRAWLFGPEVPANARMSVS
jgi:hypothetical protein